MPNKNRKSILARLFINQKVFFVFCSILLILIFVPLTKNITRQNKINNDIKDLEGEIKSLENKNTDLQKLIKYLNSDQFAEEQARLNMDLKKEGEKVVIVKNNPFSENSTKKNPTDSIFNIPGLSKAQPEKDIANPQRWWQYFFDHKL